MAVSNVAVFTLDYVPPVNLTPVALDLQSQAAVAASSSNLFIIQHASGPQGNMDAAMSALLSSMQNNGLNFFKTSAIPLGLFGANDVIIIKVNGQSPQRGGTNTDLAKSLVKTIVGHPDGFTGEVVIADNGQSSGGVDMTESNAYDHSQSMTDVAGMFPTYKVSAYSWWTIASDNVADYSSGNYQDGHVVNSTPNNATGVTVSYPKFQTAYGTYISLKNGVWSQSTQTYDDSRLKIINMPIFKSHYTYGATASVKNYMGVGSQSLTGQHDTVGNGGMGTLMVETRFPTLNVLDGVWINANPFQPGEQSGIPPYEITDCGPFTTYGAASYTDVIGASTDPVALEYWFAKNVAIPAAVQRGYAYTSSIDPDYGPVTQNLVQSYHNYLTASMNEIKNSGQQVTMLESEMNVYVTSISPHLSWAGKTWTIVDGTWSVVNNKLYGLGSAEALITADNTAQSDYAVVMNTTIDTGTESSVVIRYVDENNFYWMGVGCWGSQFSIGRMLNGVPTEIASYGLASSVQQGVNYNLIAVANYTTLSLYVDGTQVLQTTDNALGSGGFGIRTFGSSIQVFDVFATSPPTTTFLSFSLSPNPAIIGQSIVLHGNLSDSFNQSLNNTEVNIYLYGAYTASLFTNASGWFRASGLVNYPGTFTVNVTYAGNSTYNPSNHTETLTVNTIIPTKVSLTLSPNPVTIGQTVTLKGNLTDVADNPIGGAPLELWLKIGANPMQYVAALSTNSTGWYQASGVVTSVGTYEVAVVYRGSSQYYLSYKIETLTVNPPT